MTSELAHTSSAEQDQSVSAPVPVTCFSCGGGDEIPADVLACWDGEPWMCNSCLDD